MLSLATLMLFGGAPIALVGMAAGELVRWLCFPRQPVKRSRRLEREPKLVITAESAPF